MQEKGDQELMNASKRNFTGLPIPAGAAAAVSANLFLMSPDFHQAIQLGDMTRTGILAAVMLLLGYLMVCRLKFPSLKTLRVRVSSFRMVFVTVIVATVFSYGLLHHFAFVFFLFAWLYVVVALVLSAIRLISGRKSQTLEDFEPEPDDLE